MSRLARFGNIIKVVCKYRLDLLLDKSSLPWAIRLALSPAALLGSAKGS